MTKKTEVNRSQLFRELLPAYLKKMPQTEEEIHLWDNEIAWPED